MPFCSYCGSSLQPDSSFCSSCGKPVSRASDVLTTVPNATPIAGAPGKIEPNPSGLLGANSIAMKKKILSLTEHYDFETPEGQKLGEGNGNFFQMPAKFVVSDVSAGEVMQVHGKLISLRHEFTLYDNAGSVLGSMKKKIAKLIGQEYWLEQDGRELMRVYGNFTNHDYKLEIDGQQVAQVHKKWVSARDQFGISITGQVDARLVIGAVIVVEHLEVTKRNSNNSGFGISFG